MTQINSLMQKEAEKTAINLLQTYLDLKRLEESITNKANDLIITYSNPIIAHTEKLDKTIKLIDQLFTEQNKLDQETKLKILKTICELMEKT